MSTLLIILLILTVGNIIWLIMDLLTIKEYWGIPLAILIITAYFGWGMGGNMVHQTTKNIKVTSPVEIMKSSTTVFIEIDGKVWEFKEHKDYININDSTSFYYEIDYNIYNSEISRQLKYNN